MNAIGTKPQSGDPIAAAEQFATSLRRQGFLLDFSCQSLETEIDRMFDLPLFHCGRQGLPTIEQARNESGLAAYLGETLRRRYSGEWQGEFYPESPHLNFYSSFIRFRQYQYFPSSFVGYRLSNGSSEGTFAEYLRQIISKIQEATISGVD